MDKVFVFPYERGDILTKLTRLSNLQRLKEHHKTICRMLDGLDKSISRFNNPKNPREDLIQIHERKTFQVLMRQKVRREEQIKQLEEQIRQDIEDSQKE